jgi:hypothetical protein
MTAYSQKLQRAEMPQPVAGGGYMKALRYHGDGDSHMVLLGTWDDAEGLTLLLDENCRSIGNRRIVLWSGGQLYRVMRWTGKTAWVRVNGHDEEYRLFPDTFVRKGETCPPAERHQVTIFEVIGKGQSAGEDRA